MSRDWIDALNGLNDGRVASLGVKGIAMDVIAETAVKGNGNIWPSSPHSYLERHPELCMCRIEDEELWEVPMTDNDIEQAFELLVSVGLLEKIELGYRVNPQFVRFAR